MAGVNRLPGLLEIQAGIGSVWSVPLKQAVMFHLFQPGAQPHRSLGCCICCQNHGSMFQLGLWVDSICPSEGQGGFWTLIYSLCTSYLVSRGF